MKAILLDLLDSSSLPGIPILLKCKKLISKFVWFLGLILLLSLSVKYIIDTLQTYYNYELVTNIFTYNERSSPFPAISFCFKYDNSKNIPHVDDVVISCFFELNPCYSRDFEVFQDVNSVICYRFNSFNEKSKRRNAHLTSMQNSFKIAFDLKAFVNFLNATYSKINVQVDNASTKFRYTRPYYQVTGNFLSEGVNSIQIEREYIQRLEEPYNHCVKQETTDYVSSYFQDFIRNNKTYQQSYCFDTCVAEDIKKICNCTKYLGEHDNYSECVQSKYIDCSLFTVEEYRRKTRNLPDECFSSCPEECDSIVFRTYQSYLGRVNLTFLNFTESDRENIVLVHIYYPRLGYTVIEQSSKMDIFNFISSVGGILGLFTGLSFFTFVEIFEIFFEIFASIWSNCLKNSIDVSY